MTTVKNIAICIYIYWCIGIQIKLMYTILYYKVNMIKHLSKKSTRGRGYELIKRWLCIANIWKCWHIKLGHDLYHILTVLTFCKYILKRQNICIIYQYLAEYFEVRMENMVFNQSIYFATKSVLMSNVFVR